MGKYFGTHEIDFLIAIILCFLASFVIGRDREKKGKSAGISTYSFVIGGSMLFSFIGNLVGTDPSRVAAQVVTGIGFLGAGLILKRTQTKVTNLTTAASIWYAGALGMAIGFQLYFIASLAILYALIAFNHLPNYRTEVENESGQERSI